MSRFNIINQYVTPTSITSVLDVGANRGEFYYEARCHYPRAYFYLVEGLHHCEPGIKALGVDYSISLLSDKPKMVNFYTRKHEKMCTGSSIYRENTFHYDDREIEIESRMTTTLDILLPGKQFDIIKMDVQGSELDIVKGGVNIVNKCKALVLETPVKFSQIHSNACINTIHQYNIGSPTKEEIDEYLMSVGFKEVAVLENIYCRGTIVHADVLYLNTSI